MICSFLARKEAGKTSARLPGWERQVNAYRQDFRRIDPISLYGTRIVRNCACVEADLDKLQKRRGTKRTFENRKPISQTAGCPKSRLVKRLPKVTTPFASAGVLASTQAVRGPVRSN